MKELLYSRGCLEVGNGHDIIRRRPGGTDLIAIAQAAPTDEERDANAERLVECWNACEGFSTAGIRPAIIALRQVAGYLRSKHADASDPTDVTKWNDHQALREYQSILAALYQCQENRQ